MKLIKALALTALISVSVIFSQSTQRPQNIIILIGDGMGANYVSAAVLNLPNSPFRKFTSIGFSITCAADKLITDSALEPPPFLQVTEQIIITLELTRLEITCLQYLMKLRDLTYRPV